MGNVREATSEAISILTRTSETSRSLMLPTLLCHLDNPSAASIPSITQVISLSGLTFVSNGKEDELLYLVFHPSALQGKFI
ncbi:hypothetical protein CPB84DRAFT_1321121 [Gymnopilus junonius]|uniref:Uncharacterized protein n=1 Tax=Gymnopilus junonius TaxID=109634 RepID=A0A9P5NKJ3_GYMJU|nr:hypothetical protein CPB84DRAFT_1321121 [Gymnopilus junonius]